MRDHDGVRQCGVADGRPTSTRSSSGPPVDSCGSPSCSPVPREGRGPCPLPVRKGFLRWDKIRADDPWAYVRRCLVNGYTDWWRRRPWREQPTERLPEPSGHPDPAAGLADRDALSLALAQLTRRERAVVVLRFYQDQSEAQIADALGIAPGTVKSTNLRAMRKLRGSAHLQPEALKGQQ
jgi:RNA polymerase sigma factor (sigma-70 family)